MIIGITGTRCGINTKQKKILKKYLQNATSLLHGDCVGADEDAHQIAYGMDLSVFIYPPIKKTYRAFCVSDNIYQPEDYLVRNRRIVDNCSLLIALPKQNKETNSGGTWYTVRYARRLKKPIIIIFPNCSVSKENYSEAHQRYFIRVGERWILNGTTQHRTIEPTQKG